MRSERISLMLYSLLEVTDEYRWLVLDWIEKVMYPGT
jgi:hypothetical protein